VVIAIAVLILLALGGFGIFTLVHRDSSKAVPGVGDCVQLSKDDLVDGDFSVVNCGDPRALYRAESQHEGDAVCPGDYAPFALRNETTGPTRITLCMELNVHDGDCLTSLDDRTTAKRTDCGAVEAKQRVSVHQGVANNSACGIDEGFVLYPGQSPHTVCLSALPKRANV